MKFKFPPLTVEWADYERASEELDGKAMSLADPRFTKVCRLYDQFFKERLVYEPGLDVLHLRFAYDYEVDTEAITEPMHLVRWVLHLTGKRWMAGPFAHKFIEKVCEIKGWNPHARDWKKKSNFYVQNSRKR
jgi:hypothetical protein